MDWQTYTAIGIVTFTMLVFLVRLARPRRKSGCGHGCDCGKNFTKPVE
jgi:hypothetical protein